MTPNGTPIKELSSSNLGVSKDFFAPPPSRVIRAWERAPVAAQAPRLNGQKIWKKRGGRLSGDKENNINEAQVELEKEGVGARKRVRVLGTKENIGNAPWKKIEHASSNSRSVLAAKDVNTAFQRDAPAEFCGHESTNEVEIDGSKSIQFVPRKRTNTNHVITPKKNSRRAVSNAQSIVKRSPTKNRRRRSTRRSLRGGDLSETDCIEPTERPADVKVTHQEIVTESPPDLSPEVALASPEGRPLEGTIKPAIESNLVESSTRSPKKQLRAGIRRSSRQSAQLKRLSITAMEDEASKASVGSSKGGHDRVTMRASEIEPLDDRLSIPRQSNMCEETAEQMSSQSHHGMDSPEQSYLDVTESANLELRPSSVENDKHISSHETEQVLGAPLTSSDREESEEFFSLDSTFDPDLDVVPDSANLEDEEDPASNEIADATSETESDEDSEMESASIDGNIINDDPDLSDTIDGEIQEPVVNIPALMGDNGDVSDDDVDIDIDLLNDFVARMRATKAAKGKKDTAKRKPLGEYSPTSLMVDVIMANQIPESPDVQEEFDVRSSPSSKRRSRKNKVAAGEDENLDGQSTRRSGRTRIPVVKPPSAPSFIPVRRLGLDDEMVSRRNEEKEIATLTRVNTRKNKAEASPAAEVLVRLAVEKELVKRNSAFREMKERREKYDEEKFEAQKSQKKKAKSVTWAEKLEDFQSSEGQVEAGKDKGPKAEAKKTAVKVGVRSSKLARVPPVNGTPVSKRKTKGRS
ncbi:hypothetical protein F5884DRAFT_762201 [Xylogone sp. PMI_703]|nr:hypothetical protein F5884DRAFT_762201 [Xylogone sp. PMI_703]